MDWKSVELDMLVSINQESINKKYPYDVIDYIDISSVGTGELKHTTEYEIEKAPSRAKRIVREGDVILSTVRPVRRSFLYLKNPKENQVVSTGFAVLRAKEDVLDSRFLYYLISNQEFTNYLVSQEQGAAYPAVNVDSIKKAKVMIPSLEVQKEIANILGNYDDKIETNLKINELLDEIIKITYKHYFLDFGPFKEQNFIESEVGLIPFGWNVGSIADLTTVSTGKRPDSISDSGSVPIYGGAGEMGFTEGFIYDEEIFVIGRVGAYCGGEVFRVKGKSWPSDNALVVQPKSKELYSFVYSTLANFNFDSIKGGSSQPLITQSGVKNIKVVLPPEDIIREFNETVKSSHQMIMANIKENILLAKSRDYLTTQLLSGTHELIE